MAPTPTELRHRQSVDIEPEIATLQEIEDYPKTDRKLVGIEGKWYDVTDFIPKHPGGPIIEQFIGKDASTVFRTVWGHKDVLKYRKPVGTYKTSARHPADEEFERLIKKFEKWGWFTTDWGWYAKKAVVALSLFAMAFVCVIGFAQYWYMQYLGAVFLAFSWQQSGFIMHDCMHKQLFRDSARVRDKAGGLFFGSFIFGFSAHWWHDEHIIHHAMTNTVDHENRFADPQMWETVWAQHEKMYPLFKGLLQYYLIKIQHITFIPFVTMGGRFEICLDSYRLERRWYEIIALIGHWIWMVYLLSWLPSWRTIVCFYILAATVEGVFHFQLILSHYCKMFYTVNEFHSTSWFVSQVLSNMNIDVPWWQDWYYGGLNFHIEHHLFPRIGRKHLRAAGAYVQEICERHNIDYDMCSFTSAMTKTLSHLKQAGDHYKLEFR